MKYSIFRNIIELINVTEEAMTNYHYLWWTYNNNKQNFTLYCIYDRKKNDNCTKLGSFTLARYDNDWRLYVRRIRKHPDQGKLIEGELNDPPCSNDYIVRKFKIDKICNLQDEMAKNKRAFAILMKYTKQSPVYMEDEKEYNQVFSGANRTLASYGYTFKKNKVF